MSIGPIGPNDLPLPAIRSAAAPAPAAAQPSTQAQALTAQQVALQQAQQEGGHGGGGGHGKAKKALEALSDIAARANAAPKQAMKTVEERIAEIERLKRELEAKEVDEDADEGTTDDAERREQPPEREPPSQR